MYEKEAKMYEEYIDNKAQFYDNRRRGIDFISYTFTPKYRDEWRVTIIAVKTNKVPHDWYFFLVSLNQKEILEHFYVMYGECGIINRNEVIKYLADYVKSQQDN